MMFESVNELIYLMGSFSSLPATGEGSMAWITYLAIALVVVGGILLFRNSKKKD